MDFNEYQKHAMRTARDTSPDRLLLNGVMGLCGEAGECIDIVKKHLFQGHELDRAKLIDEASDCLWYLASLAESFGVTMESIAIHNVEKLKKRYPAGFRTEDSINRD